MQVGDFLELVGDQPASDKQRYRFRLESLPIPDATATKVATVAVSATVAMPQTTGSPSTVAEVPTTATDPAQLTNTFQVVEWLSSKLPAGPAAAACKACEDEAIDGEASHPEQCLVALNPVCSLRRCCAR